MAGVEELRAQLKEAEAALAVDPSDAELRQLTVELRTLIQSASGAEPEAADDGRYVLWLCKMLMYCSEDIFADEDAVKRAPKRARAAEPSAAPKPAAAAPVAATSQTVEIVDSDEGDDAAPELEADELDVKVVGDDLPEAISTFAQAGLHPLMLRNIEKVAGYRRPTIVQKYSLPILLKRRDLLATAQTGALTAHTSRSLTLLKAVVRRERS